MTPMLTAIDFGASGSRAIYTLEKVKTSLYVTEPHVCQVIPQLVEEYEKSRFNSNNFSSGWVEVKGSFYAFGNLAKQHLRTNPLLNRHKFELAIFKVLAIIGAISQIHALAEDIALNLAVLLPYIEFNDRELLELTLRDYLKSFRFCGIEKSFRLETFIALPEGAGAMIQGREMGTNFHDLNLITLMLGYRDVSLLQINQGELLRGETESLGFNNLIKSAARGASERDHQRLTQAICKAGSNVNANALKPLLNGVGDTYKEYKLTQLKNAILEARNQYWLTLSEWLRLQTKGDEDEIIIAGGTSRYLKAELSSFLPTITRAKLQWCEELEKRIRATFPEQVKANSLEYRLADVYGLFFYLYNRTFSLGAKTNE
jgi:hypothetical protein